MDVVQLSDSERNELEAIRRRADRNAHGHISHALRLQLLDDVATLTTAVGGALIMAVSAFLIGTDETNKMAEVAVAVIASAITLVAIWQAIWQPARRSRNHQTWSAKFFVVEDNCRLGLAGLVAVAVPGLMTELRVISEETDLVPERRWRRTRRNATAESPTMGSEL